MGTNYYAHFDKCWTCGHTKETMHIGKNSYGWQFHFHGKKEDSYMEDENTPIVTSKKEWRAITSQDNVIIVDEYDEEIDYKDFWELVEGKQSNKEAINHYRIVASMPVTQAEKDYLLRERKRSWNSIYDNSEHLEKIWIDDEGYCFDEEEFC